MDNPSVLLDVRNLKKYFPIQHGFFGRIEGYIKAVDDVTIAIRTGETLGIVGESGCGKTTLGRCVVRILDPTDGEIWLSDENGESTNIASLEQRQLRVKRRGFQIIFQDPYASLDPRMTILNIVGEPLYAMRISSPAERTERVRHLLEVVGLKGDYLNRYPQAFSGGQRQRIGIARALATNPRLVVADEPVSALDVSVQAQILNLLSDLQAEFALTYLFISHDLSVVRHVSNRVAVMYVGRLVESAETRELYARPAHPYTIALLSAVPTTDRESRKQRIILPGEPANPAQTPPGCPFHPRCSHATELCREVFPEWREVSPEHSVACHHPL